MLRLSIVLLFLFSWLYGDRELGKQAKELWQGRQYVSSAAAIAKLGDDFLPQEASYWAFNRAQGLFWAESLEAAYALYPKSSLNNQVLSISWNQLGVIAIRAGRGEEAKHCFQESLRLDEKNQVARRNLEWLLRNSPPPPPPPPPPLPPPPPPPTVLPKPEQTFNNVLPNITTTETQQRIHNLTQEPNRFWQQIRKKTATTNTSKNPW
ncbi:MAG: tetratricopeptide repeat protein [Bacteroidia bacterium]|nr:tetratricopeptide repeat protein [Bacteroidia bacterium]